MMPVVKPDSAEPEPSRHRVLIADDNELIRSALAVMITSLGHDVKVTSNGLEAVEAASAEAFDLILLDVQMPVMGGFEAAELIRRGSLESDSPRIIGISAEPDNRLRAGEHGMLDFLVKPIRLSDLVRVVVFPRFSSGDTSLPVGPPPWNTSTR